MRHLFLFALVTFTAAWSAAIAQPPAAPPKDVPWVVSLSITPMAVPKPALKYLLLPDARDLNPGNQIPAFYKCFMEQSDLYRNKEAIEKREKWSTAPLHELAQEKALIGYGGSSARQADYAARLETVDWATLSQLKVEGVFLALRDVQQLRELALVLKVKLRAEIARREFDAAIYTTQTLLVLARAYEYHPTLIGSLVGHAFAFIAIDVLDEFVQQPGAPNLFWALTDLPNPIMGLRNGMAGERVWLNRDLNVLGLHEPLPEEELKKLSKLIGWFTEQDKKQTVLEWYQSQSSDAAALKTATEHLISHQFPKDKLAKFLPLQIIMADDFMKYLVFRDDLMKWTNLPLAQIPTNVLTTKPPTGLMVGYVPAFYKVKQAQARLQQWIDLLRIEEAIRDYAATNSNKLPASLEQIKLPLQIDPVSGKSYFYELKDGKALIHGTVPADRINDRSWNRILEIKVSTGK
jgi:hypothetical protein